MLITVKSSNLVWTAPDGSVKIWDITDQNGQKWQTRSQKIAEAIDQALDCTTTVSKTGKTYLVQAPREGTTGGGFQQAVQGSQSPSRPQGSADTVERFEKAVGRFEKAVDRFTGKLGSNGDIIADPDDDAKKVADFFEGEIVDDIN